LSVVLNEEVYNKKPCQAFGLRGILVLAIGGLAPSLADEPYKPVRYSETMCAFKGYHYRGIVAGLGSVKPDGGCIGEFPVVWVVREVAPTTEKLKLVSHKVEDGFVNTKRF